MDDPISRRIVFYSQSEPWETAEGWESKIAEVVSPVSRYPMAPREARAILEAAGRLMAQGYRARDILETLRWDGPYAASDAPTRAPGGA